MPNAGKCAGEEFAAISGLVILSSYLVLFIMFYLATYKRTPSGRPRRNTGKEALIKMKDVELPDAHLHADTVPATFAAASIAGANEKQTQVQTLKNKTNRPVTRSRKA
ncbi:hypothetical protein KEM54_000469 [Ascosphaera aggregata]|nr:hypothetical protein KEM54_000469 [Ascosphaera aggregata]